MAIKNLVPRNHKEGKLGVESKKWKEVHAETGSFERIEGTFSLSTGSITAESGSFGVLRVDGDTKFSGSVLISGSTPGYPATLTVDGNISASGTISASVIYAQEGYFSASSVWIGNESLGETLITDLKAGKPLRADRHTLTYRVRDYVQEDNFMHLGSSDRIYFNVGGKTIFDLDTGNNTIFLGKESGIGNIHPTVSASGDVNIGGNLNVTGTIGGNNIQGGAFETDGLGDIMPTSEIIFTDIYYEVDANNDLMPRL